MGSCFSVEEDGQLQSQNKSSSNKPGKCGDSSSHSKGGSGSSNTIVIIPKNVKDLRQSPGNGDLDIFTHEEMKLATKHFRPDQVLGEGGFGIVYKGVIDDNVRPGYKTTKVAIKELDPEGLQGDREWLAEVNYLGQLRHPNLVKLIGYCCEGDHRLLVYEYMASGSLEKHLFLRVRATLTWDKRLKIALDAAKGLAFLHGVEKSIIYRDFKTSNILLDVDFNAKLSDFGLARVGPTGDQTHVSTGLWVPMVMLLPRHLTARSDVYGFGVVLLEMLIGRAMDKSRLAESIISQNPKGRPVMSQVIEILEPLVTQEVSRENVVLQNGGGSVTLYEVPKSVSENPKEKNPLKSESERDEGEAVKSKQGNGRSKSEPPKECDLYEPSPDALQVERSSSNGR
ncbi:hypothetical protein DH2020_014753 [Rehmannia glutinosa]|uniref:Protein kinase domain-containing protein n=1 Tax=Rehmannia glutinosa TaxID=99300 RepID=A0ABR0WYW5_REHGL